MVGLLLATRVPQTEPTRRRERLEEKVLENEDPRPWDSPDLGQGEQYLGLQAPGFKVACPQG